MKPNHLPAEFQNVGTGLNIENSAEIRTAHEPNDDSTNNEPNKPDVNEFEPVPELDQPNGLTTGNAAATDANHSRVVEADEKDGTKVTAAPNGSPNNLAVRNEEMALDVDDCAESDEVLMTHDSSVDSSNIEPNHIDANGPENGLSMEAAGANGLNGASEPPTEDGIAANIGVPEVNEVTGREMTNGSVKVGSLQNVDKTVENRESDNRLDTPEAANIAREVPPRRIMRSRGQSQRYNVNAVKCIVCKRTILADGFPDMAQVCSQKCLD